MVQFSDRLLEELRNPVEEFISELESDYEGDIPTERIVIPDDGEFSQKDVPRFDELVDDFSLRDEGILEEAADWMFETDAINNEDCIWSLEDGVEPYRRSLTMLISSVLSHARGFNFDDHHYKQAFDGLFATIFNRDIWWGSFTPIANFECEVDEIELNHKTDVGIEDEQNINSIKISKVTPIEKASIYSFYGSMDIREFPRHSNWEYILKMEGRSVWPETLFNDHIDMIESALRLFGVKKPDFKTGPRYDLIKGARYENEGVYTAMGLKPPKHKIKYSTDRYYLSQEESDEFRIHWDRYKNYFYTGNKEELQTSVSQPLRRFNYMHTRENREDKIIDCALGFETSLTKDIRGGYSIYLPVRAALLLLDDSQYDTNHTFNYFKNFYKVRNKIIHSGGKVESVEINGENLSPKEFVNQATYFFAKVIIGYAEQSIQGRNVTQTNQEYIDELLTEVLHNASELLDED